MEIKTQQNKKKGIMKQCTFIFISNFTLFYLIAVQSKIRNEAEKNSKQN
uniref:Uncharacterized protein n=1 Tax=Nelumbo nucifera TaxID=4432 RepID=A0A822XVU7_NELNU|nr:TPA_asm: hypothetical protein HUJ06_024358 [Nelumbo nucifera]